MTKATLAKVTEDHVKRARCLMGVGLGVKQVSQWLATDEADIAEADRLKADYALFEEMAPPDVPRKQFVGWCFTAWEEWDQIVKALKETRRELAEAEKRIEEMAAALVDAEGHGIQLQHRIDELTNPPL